MGTTRSNETTSKTSKQTPTREGRKQEDPNTGFPYVQDSSSTKMQHTQKSKPAATLMKAKNPMKKSSMAKPSQYDPSQSKLPPIGGKSIKTIKAGQHNSSKNLSDQLQAGGGTSVYAKGPSMQNSGVGTQ